MISGKGGVQKTSTTANLAGEVARVGYKVLAIDLDLSGNLGLDLGYADRSEADRGMGLVMAMAQDTDVPVLKDVRANLDVIPGGSRLTMLKSIKDLPEVQEQGGLTRLFARKLAELIEREGYELVIIDSAPGNFDPTLQDISLAAARHVVIPTRTDPGSWDGIAGIGPKVADARRNGNPEIEYLGILIVGNQSQATGILKITRVFLNEAFGGKVPVLDTRLRYSEAVAQQCRIRGQLANELAKDAAAEGATRLEALREARRSGDVLQLPPALSRTSESLGDDYRELTREILMRIAAHESTTPIAKGQ